MRERDVRCLKFALPASLFMFALSGESHGDDPAEIKIDWVAKVDKTSEAPELTTFKTLVSERTHPSGTIKGYEMNVRIGKDTEITLGRATAETRKSDGLVFETGVAQRSIVTGWLAGAEDLLVIAWVEVFGGTGHYSYVNSAVVRMADGKAEELLRQKGLSGGATRHIYGGRRGTVFHYFQYDPVEKMLVDTISHHNELLTHRWRPLHHRVQTSRFDPGTMSFRAVIHEKVIHRYSYRNGKLESRSIELYYKTQEGDSLGAIARCYLGPLAPGEAVLDANRQLKELAVTERVKYPDAICPPKGALVKIPVPQDWLRKSYAR